MKKVLVTGASGFIGTHIVERLLDRGFHVIASSSSEKKAQTKSWYKSVEYIPFKLESFDDKKNYFNFFSQPDVLIHLAWEGLPNYKENFHLDENLPRHTAFIVNMIKNGLSDLTVAGTCLEYGLSGGCLVEDAAYHPIVPYAIAKDELRKNIASSITDSEVSFKWARLFYMYGQGQSAKSLISQLDKALENGESEFNMSGGEQVRDFLPVEMMAAYIVDVATQKKIDGIINCCSGIPIKLLDFVQQYLEEKKKSIKLNLGYYDYLDYEPMSFWGDTKKLKSILENEQSY